MILIVYKLRIITMNDRFMSDASDSVKKMSGKSSVLINGICHNDDIHEEQLNMR